MMVYLRRGQKFAYSIGHVLNDLCASMWFSYLLIFFHQVKRFNNVLSGNLMLIGQISDALCTPFIGFESDRTNGICNLGKRKTWHLIGTISVICSFPFLFNLCIDCEHSADWAQFIYYAPLVVIFQFGWASTQISHLSLIPEITPDANERVGLNGLRYAFTVLSNLTVYLIFWLLFAFNSSSKSVDTSKLSVVDAPNFQLLVFIVVGIGCVFSAIFHFYVKEKKQNPDIEGRSTVQDALSESESGASIERSMMAKVNRMYVTCWLKEPQFYQIAVIYMSTRLFVNVSQVYLPQYCIESLMLEKKIIAIIPLVVFSSGFLTSLVMKYVNTKIGRKGTYCLGAVIGISSCIWFYFISEANNYYVYPAAILLGIGGSTMLVTSLTMTADLIAENTESGAFVYGAMSFTDKLSNGIAIELIQVFHPCSYYLRGCCPLCVGYYRNIISFVPGSCAVLGLIFLVVIIPQVIGKRRKDNVKLLKSPVGVSSKISTEICYDSNDENSSLLGKTGSVNTH